MQPTDLNPLWRERTGVAIVVTIFAALAITAAGGWHWLVGWLESANAPAWVQAVGSVAAIGAGALVIRWQVAHESRREARRETRQRLETIRAIRDLVALASEHFIAARAALSSVDAWNALVSDVDAAYERIEMLEAFDVIDVNGIPGAPARFAFMRAAKAFNAARAVYSTYEQHTLCGRPFDRSAADLDHARPVARLTSAQRQLDEEVGALEVELLDVKG